jgi:ADP-ribose pyrophosphatase YjhB (NUDIX family)
VVLAGEDILVAAARELLEETGYVSLDELYHIGSFYTSAGFTNEKVHVVLAGEVKKVQEPEMQGAESINSFHFLNGNEYSQKTKGKTKDGLVLASLDLSASLVSEML